MDLIEQFLARYRKEFDFYDQAARLAALLIERELQNAGIRAIVTSRAKSVSRLEEKARQRDVTKKYKSIDKIYRDIVDLAGTRIALYFPGEREQVGKIIAQLFVLEGEPKSFPEASKKNTQKKRFSGYSATHYRVHLREASLNEVQQRYALALVEIQVASVLMHAWAEVEHDLVYKPQSGSLSEDEHAFLDQINGMAIAGEVALEQLQRAGNVRIAQQGRKFANHYDLANYLLNQGGSLLSADEPDLLLGKINLLFKLLKELNLLTPKFLKPYISALNKDFERRPLADQIIDQILAEDLKRYTAFENIRAKDSLEFRDAVPEAGQTTDHNQEAVGRFLTLWIEFERLIRKISGGTAAKPWLVPTTRVIAELANLSQRSVAEIERIRRFRNNLVHGVEAPSTTDIDQATSVLQALLIELRNPPTSTSPN